MQLLKMKCFFYTNQNWMVQTTSKVFIKDHYVQSRKYKCGNKKIGHEIKSLWFENVDTTIALRTTATTIWLLHPSKPLTMAQFSPPFTNVVTSDNIMPYSLKLKDEDFSG